MDASGRLHRIPPLVDLLHASLGPGRRRGRQSARLRVGQRARRRCQRAAHRLLRASDGLDLRHRRTGQHADPRLPQQEDPRRRPHQLK